MEINGVVGAVPANYVADILFWSHSTNDLPWPNLDLFPSQPTPAASQPPRAVPPQAPPQTNKPAGRGRGSFVQEDPGAGRARPPPSRPSPTSPSPTSSVEGRPNRAASTNSGFELPLTRRSVADTSKIEGRVASLSEEVSGLTGQVADLTSQSSADHSLLQAMQAQLQATLS